MLRALILVALLALSVGTAAGQDYPTKALRLVVGFPPGGGNDVLARLMAGALQDELGKPVVVDNKPGADGIIAAEIVARAAPDGHTLMIGSTAQMTMNPVLFDKLPYDPVKDFEPVSMIGMFPVVLAVHPSVAAASAAELLALARAQPGKLNYSAGSTAFQLVTEMFKQMTGTDVRHIPYKGSAQAVAALLAGDVQLTFVDSPAIMAHVKAGKLRGLAVSTAQRVPTLPDLPTVAETGVPGYEFVLWSALFAPGGTPRPIITRLQELTVKIVNTPAIREKIAATGTIPVGGSSQSLADTIRRYIAKNAQVVAAGNLKSR